MKQDQNRSFILWFLKQTISVNIRERERERNQKKIENISFLQQYCSLAKVTWRQNDKAYLRVASALSIVTLSLVASRLGRPRSKYLISSSRKGKISCETWKQVADSLRTWNDEITWCHEYHNYLIFYRFPENSSHFISCIMETMHHCHTSRQR